MRDLVGEFDATVWAAEFRETAERLYGVDLDEGWLIGWFANALMAGYDEHVRREQHRPLREVVRAQVRWRRFRWMMRRRHGVVLS